MALFVRPLLALVCVCAYQCASADPFDPWRDFKRELSGLQSGQVREVTWTRYLVKETFGDKREIPQKQWRLRFDDAGRVQSLTERNYGASGTLISTVDKKFAYAPNGLLERVVDASSDKVLDYCKR